MAYLNLDLDYFTHPKTMRLIGLLGQGAEILPVRLWCHAGKHHAKDGVLEAYEPREIEAIVGWKGEQGAFVSAMLRVGFLGENERGYALHEWIDHEGHLVMFKKRAQRAAFKRWGMKHATSIAKSPRKQSHKQCPLPNHTVPTIPTKTEPAEEGRIVAAKIAAPLTPQAAFVEKFRHTYEARTAQPYKADTKDFVMAAGLIKRYTTDACEVKAMILADLCEKRTAWFTKKDGWASYTLGNLSQFWNEILPRVAEPTKEEALTEEMAKWRRT